MTDEPLDLAPFVKSFEMSMKSGLKPITDGEAIITYQAFHKTNINLDFIAFREEFLGALANSCAVMKLHQRGKFWFDRSYEIDVNMKLLTLDLDGSVTADYEGTNIINKTDYRLLARFLRWILHR